MTGSVADTTEDRLTVESLRFYVPFFHKGEEAERILVEEGDTLFPHERNLLEVQARWKPLAVSKIESMCRPLIIREIKKLISSSHLKDRDDLFNLLYEAGVRNGMIKGLRHFDIEKIDKSATNYLFQWIVTYARKELATQETAFGIPPSRFQKLKKIAAVRKKLTEQYGRYATNSEVLNYLHSGQADIKNMSGRIDAPKSGFASNRSITIEMVQEQETFEKTMAYVDLLDPLEDYSHQLDTAVRSRQPFSETVFGSFIQKHRMSKKAVAVIMSEMGAADDMTKEAQNTVANMSKQEYRSILRRFKEMVTDPEGPFQDFIKQDNTFSANSDLIVNSDRKVTNIVRKRYMTLLFDEDERLGDTEQ